LRAAPDVDHFLPLGPIPPTTYPNQSVMVLNVDGYGHLMPNVKAAGQAFSENDHSAKGGT
jgi:hypothetical protein